MVHYMVHDMVHYIVHYIVGPHLVLPRAARLEQARQRLAQLCRKPRLRRVIDALARRGLTWCITWGITQ